MRTKKTVKLIVPVILLALMGAGGTVIGDDGMEPMAATGTQTFKVCLPPAWSLKLPASKRFETVLDGEAVLDWETGLTWEKSPDTTRRSWKEAINYAYYKTVGGRKGWRLPTIEELASLIDMSVSGSPKLPSGHPFTDVQSDYYYWSSTYIFNDVDCAWYVDFNEGDVSNFGKLNELYMWRVRGGYGHDGR